MPFPAYSSNPANEQHFLIQDPFGLGRVVLPVWNLMPDSCTLTGLGSAFRIDPHGSMISAYHIFEDLLCFGEKGSNRPDPIVDANPIILEIGGMALGAAPITGQNWLPVSNFITRVRERTDPFTQRVPQNLTEWIALEVPSKIFGHGQHQFGFCSDREVLVGEKLLAVGYADMSIGKRSELSEAQIISSYLYGSVRQVVEVIPPDTLSSRPWPRYVVDGDWPSGMSGGPVYDENGLIVGLVSTGSPGGGYATARALWDDCEETRPPLIRAG